MQELFGTDAMGETAENVAEEWKIARADQDAFALRSQLRARAAQKSGRLAPGDRSRPCRAGKETVAVAEDEHPRDTTLEALARLKPAFRAGGTVTAGNASGVNDGACALLVASERAAEAYGLTPRARIVAGATAGVPPRIMGIGPVPATRKLLARAGLVMSQIDVVELNEAFAAQALAVLRDLGLPDDAEHVNPNGGAIALGHPLGMSGARLATTATSSSRRGAAATPSARCASASARASPSCWSASEWERDRSPRKGAREATSRPKWIASGPPGCGSATTSCAAPAAPRSSFRILLGTPSSFPAGRAGFPTDDMSRCRPCGPGPVFSRRGAF